MATAPSANVPRPPRTRFLPCKVNGPPQRRVLRGTGADRIGLRPIAGDGTIVPNSAAIQNSSVSASSNHRRCPTPPVREPRVMIVHPID